MGSLRESTACRLSISSGSAVSSRPYSMGGHQRLVHPKFFSHYVYGFFAFLQVNNFMYEQWYGIPRSKNPEIMWPWWHEIMRKKEDGLIPMEMPGYMLSKYRNEPEERWNGER